MQIILASPRGFCAGVHMAIDTVQELVDLIGTPLYVYHAIVHNKHVVERSNVPPQGGRKHPEQQYIQLDTTNILFICAGSFVGLEDIIKKRLGSKSIGFASEASTDDHKLDEETILANVQAEDVLEFGMIPELIGRLPIITPLMPLTADTLVNILTEPKNALVRQYQYFFTMEDSELEFTKDALYELAKQAIERKTGARALRSVMEELMLELMYDLPDVKAKGAKFVITGDNVRNPVPLDRLRVQQKESA